MLCNKKLAFYIRLSLEDFDLKTSDKTESNSVSNQRKLLHDYYDSHPELKLLNSAMMVIPGLILTVQDL